LRERVAANAAILKQLAEIDKTLLEHDTALRDIYQKLLPLLAPAPEPPRRQILGPRITRMQRINFWEHIFPI